MDEEDIDQTGEKVMEALLASLRAWAVDPMGVNCRETLDRAERAGATFREMDDRLSHGSEFPRDWAGDRSVRLSPRQ